VGKAETGATSSKGGLGTSLVAALAHQLSAQVEIKSGASGMQVSITHAVFTPAITAATPSPGASLPKGVEVRRPVPEQAHGGPNQAISAA
jgi:hypothetical protein